MSKIIEIIGPPAVGKTTIYEALTNRWRKNDLWAPQTKFLPIISKANFGTALFWRIQVGGFLGKPLIDQQRITRAAYSFLQKNDKFSSLCWELIHKNRIRDHLGVDNRLRSAFYVYYIFGLFQTIVNSADPRVCLSDELLVQRVIQLTDEGINTKEIFAFIEALPLPESLVLLDAPAYLLAQRAFERSRNIIRHSGRNLKNLEQLSIMDKNKFKLVAEGLKKRGVSVLCVDTSKNTTDCVDEVFEFIWMKAQNI